MFLVDFRRIINVKAETFRMRIRRMGQYIFSDPLHSGRQTLYLQE